MVTFAQLNSLRPQEFAQAADGWREVSSAAAAAMDRINHQINAKLRASMRGEAVDAAIDRLVRLAENFHYTRTECALIHAALNDLADDMRTERNRLRSFVDGAIRAGFEVTGDGRVTPHPDSGEHTAEREQLRRGYQLAVDDAIYKATEADQGWSRVLYGLKARNSLHLSTADWADTTADRHAVRGALGNDLPRSDIPQKKSPRQNASWWRGLSADQQAAYLALYPKAIGALDGLPAVVRDDANRALLAATEADLRLRLEAVPPEPEKYPRYSRPGRESAEWLAWNAEYGDRKRDLLLRLQGVEAIQERFRDTGERGLPEAYLLGFDPAGDSRVILANGNPDTADHTAVFVPGTNIDQSKVAGEINRTEALYRQSAALSGEQRVSTIMWFGYDSPDDVIPDTLSDSYAEKGAPALNEFVDGLDAAHAPGSESHTTVVGHSYGTVLVGIAARDGNLNADDVIFVGSPGAVVGHASAMDVPAGHVWNQEAANDIVPEAGQFVHGYVRPWNWETGIDFIVPSDPEFGAHQMTTDTGQGKGPVGSHNAYWTPGSVSLRNQANVVVGRYDDVRLE